MTANDPDDRAMTDPEAPLERALIDEFLRMRGLDALAVQALPPDEAKRVMTDASVYAADKLAEVASRAHFIQQIHGDKSTTES